MNWYLVKIVYRIICGEGNHTAQFDEQVRLVTATDEQEAMQKGNYIGLQEEETFRNDKQQLVQWQFVNVTEIYALTNMTDGAEVCSQIKETDDAEAYCSFAHHKAAMLRKNFPSFTLQIV